MIGRKTPHKSLTNYLPDILFCKFFDFVFCCYSKTACHEETQTKVEKSNFCLISSHENAYTGKMAVEMHMKMKRKKRKVHYLNVVDMLHMSVVPFENVPYLLLLFLFTAEIFCCNHFCDSHSTFMACTMVLCIRRLWKYVAMREIKQNLIFERHSFCGYPDIACAAAFHQSI